MAGKPVDHLQELLSKLDEHIKQQQTKKALRTADSSESSLPPQLILNACTAVPSVLISPSSELAVLRKTPGDVDVLTCKAALLLESGSYEAALQFVDSPATGGRFPFEKVRLVNQKPCQLISTDQFCSTSWHVDIHRQELLD